MIWLFRFVAVVCLCGLSLAAAAQTTENALPVAAEAPTPANENATLIAQSAALSEPERERARTLFSTGFQLWQSGDFTAAEFAFREGLALDPANAVANFYMGDCLKRRGDRAGARTHYERAIAFGPDAPEAFRARAGLEEVNAAPTDVASMSQPEIVQALTGAWTIQRTGDCGKCWDEIVIAAAPDETLTFTCIDRCAAGRADGVGVEGAQVTLRFQTGFARRWRHVGELVAPNRIQGSWERGMFTATRGRRAESAQ